MVMDELRSEAIFSTSKMTTSPRTSTPLPACIFSRRPSSGQPTKDGELAQLAAPTLLEPLIVIRAASGALLIPLRSASSRSAVSARVHVRSGTASLDLDGLLADRSAVGLFEWARSGWRSFTVLARRRATRRVSSP